MELTQKDHRITKAEAVAMTSRYRKGGKDKITAADYKGKNVLPLCETFDRTGFDQLLAQKGCVGVRAYYGMNEQEQVHLVIVGVDAQGRDLLPADESNDLQLLAAVAEPEEEGVILDKAARCPPECPESSPLNA